MNTADTTGAVEQAVHIAARPETIWRYWTDAERMRQWWATTAELDPTPGGAYWVDIDGAGVMRGQYLELVPYERIVLTSGWDPVPGLPDVPPGSTRVEIAVIPDRDRGGATLTLRHTGIPASETDQYGAGWAHFLPKLANLVPAAEAGASS